MTSNAISNNTNTIKPVWLNIAVIVAALGNFVDTYDLVLFSVVRIKSLKELGLSGQALTDDGIILLNMQMFGMLVGGILWGILGDKRGRLSVLFGSIFMYSAANVANAFVYSVETYALWRFIAGVGLAGELGAGITLVTEILPKEKRGYGAMIVAAVGLLGAVAAVFISKIFDWRTSYIIGGVLGFLLLFLRVSVRESQMFSHSQEKTNEHGNFFMLFKNKKRLLRYLSCILAGLPTWYVIGILVTFSPEFGKVLKINGEVEAPIAVLLIYGGGAIGDLLSGYISQILKSRLKVLVLFVLMDLVFVVIYHCLQGIDVNYFYIIFFFFGIGSGFWVMLITIAAEQFGTNIRATVTTTVPNFVRAMIIPITALFNLFRGQVDFFYASILVGIICFGLSLLASRLLNETFSEDLDYIEGAK
ncbi:MAG: MFS transporter [Bacteroidetes bacterium]|nr:MAG: MFS transporter [Bacteroidota bacterium]